MLRLYDSLEPWFDKTWKPGDLEPSRLTSVELSRTRNTRDAIPAGPRVNLDASKAAASRIPSVRRDCAPSMPGKGWRVNCFAAFDWQSAWIPNASYSSAFSRFWHTTSM